MNRTKIVAKINQLSRLADDSKSWEETMRYEDLKAKYLIALKLTDIDESISVVANK